MRAERFLSLAENPFADAPADGGQAATLSVDLDGVTADPRKCGLPTDAPDGFGFPGPLTLSFKVGYFAFQSWSTDPAAK